MFCLYESLQVQLYLAEIPLLKAQLAIIGLIVVCVWGFPVDSKSVINMQQFSSICCLQHANVTILYNPIIKSQGRSVWLDLRLAFFFIVCIKKNQHPCLLFLKAIFTHLLLKNRICSCLHILIHFPLSVYFLISIEL